MLETKSLCKTYKPKKGVPVLAVDHVSLRFPEKGMVFLLGKSGSGKSTMLNLLGGLDACDEGEIIIKGISSKDFDQQRFDSYRNTYVGFIFQEYNVLEEFTVGANIALALELQGRTATDEELNRILETVDLAGYGARKPNELSGGQKQRVAIARALVKNPEIIMADEPTGALDSATGRQVLDTLKKLSAEKLVIVVSHDREYAEAYADRIIELADGKVIRDVETVQETGDTERQLVFRQTSIEIPADYHLTEEDRIQINEYLDQLQSGASIMLPGKSQKFHDTDESKIPQQDGSTFSLIKSKLPMKSAFKIGCSSLKHKKFRLVMTVLLSVTAFTLFGLVDTFGSYDHIRTCTDSLIDSDVNYASINRAVKEGTGMNEYWATDGLRFTDEAIRKASEETGVELKGLFIPMGANLSFSEQFNAESDADEGMYNIRISHFCGFSEITEQSLADMQYKLVAGKMPDGSKNEIAIPMAVCETFVKGGYCEPYDEMSERAPKYIKINAPTDMVNRVIRLMGVDYTVTGVVDTNFDFSRYERLTKNTEGMSTADELVNYMLMREFVTATNYSLTGCAMVGEGKVSQMAENQTVKYEAGETNFNFGGGTETVWQNGWANYLTRLSNLREEDVIWVDGEKTSLAENEVVIALDTFDRSGEFIDKDETALLLRKITYGEEELNETTAKALAKGISELPMTMNIGRWDRDAQEYKDENIEDVKIVGFFADTSEFSGYGSTFAVADSLIDKWIHVEEGIYDSAVGAMPKTRGEVQRLVSYCYREGDDVTERCELNSPVTYELDTVNSVLKALSKVFFWIGVGFAAFAALLMANFITTSIHYKRQEIGILRAIGSRSADVFRIFFSESFVIAMIDFVIASAATLAAVLLINYIIRREGILVTVLHFGIRQILLLFAVSIAVAAIASFLPVHRIASKKPIDAIRDK